MGCPGCGAPFCNGEKEEAEGLNGGHGCGHARDAPLSADRQRKKRKGGRYRSGL